MDKDGIVEETWRTVRYRDTMTRASMSARLEAIRYSDLRELGCFLVDHTRFAVRSCYYCLGISMALGPGMGMYLTQYFRLPANSQCGDDYTSRA